jgi:hypothetical protein
MHMNCAWVNISGGNNTNSRVLNPNDYPPMFVANIAAINTCKGQDGFLVVFPTPGKFATTATGTETAGTYSAITPTGNCTALPSRVTSTAIETTSVSQTGSASSTAKATTKTGAATHLDAWQAWKRVSGPPYISATKQPLTHYYHNSHSFSFLFSRPSSLHISSIL